MGVLRQTDRLLGVRLVAGTGAEAAASTLADGLSLVESYFGSGETAGISDALSGWFDALGEATADPSDDALRRSVVAAAQALADTVSRVATGIGDSIDSFNAQIAGGVADVNAALTEVAALNAAIGKSGSSTGPADLLDRRDQLLVELAEKVGARVDLRADGQATVFIGGHAAVSGAEARLLSTDEDADGNTTVQIAVDGGGFDLTENVGGKLGGFIEARTLAEGWVNDLDNFAFDFGTAMNTQHALGFDSSGTAGGDVFSLGATAVGAAAAMAVSATLSDDPTLLAFAGANTALAGDGNNLEAMLAIEDDTSTFAGKTPGGALSSVVSEVGAAVAAAQTDAESEAAILTDIQALRDSVSGVSTDEEAVSLLQYQAAYRAAARVVSAADEMLRQLVTLGQ
jgi:flagellar hook-associated protein 1 FlgK